MVLQRAVAAREVRADITPEDLLRAVIGLSHSYEGSDWQETVARLVAVFVDGLIVKRA